MWLWVSAEVVTKEAVIVLPVIAECDRITSLNKKITCLKPWNAISGF